MSRSTAGSAAAAAARLHRQRARLGRRAAGAGRVCTRVISIDLIGHGRSATPVLEAERYNFCWSTRDLVALLDGLGLDAVDVLGYSMGGRVALHFAVQAPERVSTLILESASAGIEDDAERVQRIASGCRHWLNASSGSGTEAFVAEWERLPLLALAPHVAESVRLRQTAQRLQNATGWAGQAVLARHGRWAAGLAVAGPGRI